MPYLGLVALLAPCYVIERLWFSTYKINSKATKLVDEGVNTLRQIALVIIAYLSPIKPPKKIPGHGF